MRTPAQGPFLVVDGEGRKYETHPTVQLAMAATHRLKEKHPERVFSVRREYEVRSGRTGVRG